MLPTKHGKDGVRLLNAWLPPSSRSQRRVTTRVSSSCHSAVLLFMFRISSITTRTRCSLYVSFHEKTTFLYFQHFLYSTYTFVVLYHEREREKCILEEGITHDGAGTSHFTIVLFHKGFISFSLLN